jgi:hypothetical protein
METLFISGAFHKMAFCGGEDMVRAKDYTWQKSRYTLLKGRWGIAIWIEAGYLMTSEIEDKNNYTEISDHIYFESMIPSSSDNIQLYADELLYFCSGLKMISRHFHEFLPEGMYLIIALRNIEFSECYVQIEGFTACAIQWASEAFHFSMPKIEAYFDESKAPNGQYIFDFSSV